MTFREALTYGYGQLCVQPQLKKNALEDSATLLLHTLGVSRAKLIAEYDRALTEDQQADFESKIARRLANEPVQYITGEREFYGLPLRVGPGVLVPRNSTEHVVEAVLNEFKAEAQEPLSPRPASRPVTPLRIVDVGTGSGAIAIALAVHLPRAQMTALDISAAALEVARENAELNGVADRVRCLESDLLSAVRGEEFDVVVSNPPYIPTSEKESLHPEIRDYEPEVSLYGGPAGMDLYRRLVPEAYEALRPNGLIAMEIGRHQENAIVALLGNWAEVQVVKDLQHYPRVVVARRK